MDGAMGSELQRLGLRLPEQRSEDLNLARPEAVRSVHRSYAEAGAELLLTNTFQANPIALTGREPAFLDETIRAAVRLAGEVAGPQRFVLIDVGPIVTGNSESADDAALERVAALAAGCVAAGVLLETCSTERVGPAAGRFRAGDRPVLLSLAYRKHPQCGYETFDGHEPEWFAERAESWGLAALGINCGPEMTVADCAAVVRHYRGATGLPLFARPNAGTPARDGDAWVYPRTPAAMAAELPQLFEAGAAMVGGCCGTTPAHIAAFRAVVDEWNARRGHFRPSNSTFPVARS
jgi:methionine synthase I (cobalamin-dependent)